MESAAFGESSMQVTVVGAGKMATGIAVAAATTGHHVTVAGRRVEAAREVAAVVASRTGAAVAHGSIGSATLASAGVVIETIVEKEAEKREVLEQISSMVADSALVATNTSSFSPTVLAGALRNPDRFIGMHFLNPAELTLVVEVVGGELSSTEAVDAGCRFVESLGKRPIRVHRDVAGYIWNRLQFALLRECLHLLELGVADAADIDMAVSLGLAPRWVATGPLATADLGGLETFALISEQLFPVLDSRADVPDILRSLVEANGSFHPWDQVETTQADERRGAALEHAARLYRG